MIERVTRYGKPGDPFVRITDEYQRDGDVLNVNRTVVSKGYVPGIQVEVAFEASGRVRVWMARHLPTVLAFYDSIRIGAALRWHLWRSRR